MLIHSASTISVDHASHKKAHERGYTILSFGNYHRKSFHLKSSLHCSNTGYFSIPDLLLSPHRPTTYVKLLSHNIKIHILKIFEYPDLIILGNFWLILYTQVSASSWTVPPGAGGLAINESDLINCRKSRIPVQNRRCVSVRREARLWCLQILHNVRSRFTWLK